MFGGAWATISRVGGRSRRVLYMPNIDGQDEAMARVRALGVRGAQVAPALDAKKQGDVFLADLRGRPPYDLLTEAPCGDIWYCDVQLTREMGKQPTLPLVYAGIAFGLWMRGVRKITIVLHETFDARSIVKVIRNGIPTMSVRILLHNDAGRTTWVVNKKGEIVRRNPRRKRKKVVPSARRGSPPRALFIFYVNRSPCLVATQVPTRRLARQKDRL